MCVHVYDLITAATFGVRISFLGPSVNNRLFMYICTLEPARPESLAVLRCSNAPNLVTAGIGKSHHIHVHAYKR